jgi:hypothetical protein
MECNKDLFQSIDFFTANLNIRQSWTADAFSAVLLKKRGGNLLFGVKDGC